MRTVQPITSRMAGDLARMLEQRGIGGDMFQKYLVQRPDELINYIRELDNINPYSSERVKQSCFYPRGLRMPSLDLQAERLRKSFEGFTPRFPLNVSGIFVPKDAEGLALIPTLISLSRLWGIYQPHKMGYGQVVEHAQVAIVGKEEFRSQRHKNLSEKNFRLDLRVQKILRPLEEDAERRGWNCLVLPVSLGKLYAGYSVRNAMCEALRNRQLPLGSAQGACILSAVPSRFNADEQLSIRWIGDIFLRDDLRWGGVPCNSFQFGRIDFGLYNDDSARGDFGGAVAFLPEE